jgi:S-adenosylmethionine synthetase
MARTIVVEAMGRRSVEAYEAEVCEHKGIGHPDTITDAVCEAASRELSKAYLREFGTVLHHNVDKGLLVAGQSLPKFGGGRFTKPIKIIIAGRATSEAGGKRLDVQKICIDAAKEYIKKNIRCGLENFQISADVLEGSGNLQEVFARSGTAPLANDTSFGVGFAPFSRLEKVVLDVARLFKSKDFLRKFPAAGDDFKIMGLRTGNDIKLTVAMAFIDKHVKSVQEYFDIKAGIVEEIHEAVEEPITVQINTLDNPGSKNEHGVYLTVSGLSAEMGDDGQVGRGNRTNGLITPNRIMSLEAAAGKNPVTHIGKTYNVLANLIARDIYEKVDAVEEVSVKLLSAIGKPIDEPQVASIEILSKKGMDDGLKKEVAAIADGWLANIAKVTKLIIEEKVSIY